MHIKKKRIHNVLNYISHIADGGNFHISLVLAEGSDKALKRAGFTLPVSSGDTVLPPGRGPISHFNANGKWQIHRDQPLKERYIRTVHWRWKQYSGRGQLEEKEDDRDIYRKCYPRTFIEPVSIELTYVEQNRHLLIISPLFKKNLQSYGLICHTINLFLELFGECELVTDNLVSFAAMVTRKVNWKILPAGRYPWPHIESHLKSVLGSESSDVKKMIIDRQKIITDFEPDETIVGLGGFSDYIAYKFKSHGIVVLESIRKDNAIYVFGKNWEEFSQLTKAEVLNKKFHLERIVHSKGWQKKLNELFSSSKKYKL